MRQFPIILKIVIKVSYRTFFLFCITLAEMGFCSQQHFIGSAGTNVALCPPPDKNSPIEANHFSDLRRSVTIRLSHFTAPLF